MSAPDDSDRVELTPTNESTVEFLLEFARIAHRSGYPTADLEERLGSLAGVLGLEGAQISATPTLLELSFGSLPRQRNYSLRMRPTTVDLDAITRLEELAREIGDGRVADFARRSSGWGRSTPNRCDDGGTSSSARMP